jgi:hypothetical protein
VVGIDAAIECEVRKRKSSTVDIKKGRPATQRAERSSCHPQSRARACSDEYDSVRKGSEKAQGLLLDPVTADLRKQVAQLEAALPVDLILVEDGPGS